MIFWHIEMFAKEIHLKINLIISHKTQVYAQNVTILLFGDDCSLVHQIVNEADRCNILTSAPVQKFLTTRRPPKALLDCFQNSFSRF